jgi:mono/diheme cytochrome c family protein
MYEEFRTDTILSGIWLLMQAKITMLIRVFFGFAAATAVATAGPSLYGDAERGAALFQSKNCMTCHSINGQGAKAAPDLGKRGGEDFTPSSLAAMLWNHAPRMWGALSKSSTTIELTAQDSADLFAYFYAARYMDPPGDAGRGKKLFTAKRCAGCHALDGSGAEGIRPDLHWESLADPIELARQMWNHAPAMRAAMAKKDLAPPTLTPAEMNDILVYLRTQPKARENRPVFQPASAETGAMLFREKGCADCHKGNLSLEKRATFGSVSQVAAAMWNHSSSMKQSSELLPEEMKRLTGYIWALRFASEGGDTAHGATVFAAKGCGSCHTNGPGPKIAGMVPDSYTLIASLTQHAPRMMQKLESARQAWPTLKDAEMRDLLAYLRQGK